MGPLLMRVGNTYNLESRSLTTKTIGAIDNEIAGGGPIRRS